MNPKLTLECLLAGKELESHHFSPEACPYCGGRGWQYYELSGVNEEKPEQRKAECDYCHGIGVNWFRVPLL